MIPRIPDQPSILAAEPVFLRRVRLRARRRALWLRALWSPNTAAKGIAISDEEVDRILTDPASLAVREAEFYETDREAIELSQLIAGADDCASRDARWCALCQAFELTQPDGDLLTLAAAVAADPAFARVCGYLHDDASACYATPMLAAALFHWQEPLVVDGALTRWRLASPHQQPQQTAVLSGAANAPWVADPFIVQWLCGAMGSDPVVSAALELISAGEVAALEVLDAETLSAVHDFVAAVRPPVEIELTAPSGSGKRTLAAQACAEMRTNLMVVDAQLLTAGDPGAAQIQDRVLRAVRLARLEGATLYWDHAGQLDARTRQSLEGACGLVFFAAESATKLPASALVARASFSMRPIDSAQRARLWDHFTAKRYPEAIRGWSLRPAEIRSAAQVAGAGVDAVLKACRSMLHSDPGELFTALPCPYVWNDIVLAPGVRRQLEELAVQARLGAEVLEGWGFERLCRMGRGLNVLFAGPSGTGKTMAAQVVARELGRELYRVDLAGVVNKYIGETEKRLKLVFEACERSAVVLFFDEADALFGQRTQVKDAHDRYANIQIDYLLQRMEQFDGVAILATNRKNDLDTAFLRRLRFIVDFLTPGPQERMALWRIALSERSPSGEELLDGIAFEWLAENVVLTGADIKSIALAAAFLARAQGTRIRMEHLLHAARRETNKQGAAWRGGDWSANANG
jgi:ATPase family associated with various cellular activities (AAA)